MKKKYFLLIALLFSFGFLSESFAQGTETFEAPLPVNSTSWTNAGLTFSSSSANFDTDEFVGAGAGGSDRYIDNIDAPGTGSIYSISITGGATLFTMQSMEVYVSSIATGDNPTDDGTMIFRGFNGATEEFSYTKPMGTFPTTFGSTNGFFLLDFSAIPVLGDESGTNIDRLEMELTGAFQYFAVDNFEFDNEVLEADPPEVQSITVVGMPNSTATSVDFLVTFNENANNVTTDDFSVDATGGVTGSITGISGSGTMYTLTVSGISGEGTMSIDLNGGTDIEDDLGNSPPPAFTAGEVHVVSRCFQETFESFTAGDFMWSSNGVTYTSGTANFSVEFFANGGAGSSDQFLSNVNNQGTGAVYTLSPTGPELFNVEALDIYLSSELNGANPTDDGTLTLEGRLSGSTLYTIQKTTGFPTDFSVNNGFYTVDFATEGMADYSLTNIDELRITLGGSFQYVALDNFEHCEEIVSATPPIVQSISLVGNPPANSASVDFTVIFNEDAVNVTTDDFSLDLLGSAVGTISGISGSGNTYTVSVNSISGEGSLRLDLNAGTDIEDLSGNTPPDPFTDGERFIVSICDVETFESFAIGTFAWTTNTVPWTAGSADFGVDEFIGAGAGGSDRYLDNVTSQGTGDVNSIAITDTQMVKMGSMEIYVSSILNGDNPTDDGTLTVVGRLDGTDQYTIVKSMGFPTTFGSTQGFYLWDFATEGGMDNSMTDIDELVLTLGGSFQYLAVDNFKFCMDPPDETEVALAGGTLTITDINGGTSDDVFDLSVVGPNLRITNTVDRFLISGAGVVEVNDNTVDVLLANITNGVVLNAEAGNDSYTQSTAITLPGATNDYTVQNIETFTQSAALDVGGTITYGVTGAVGLNNTTSGGDLNVTAVGNITDTGTAIVVGGTTTLDAVGSTIDINTAIGNSFAGEVTIDAGRMLDFVSNAPVQFGVISLTDNAAFQSSVTNNGSLITFNGNVTTAGIQDFQIRSSGGAVQGAGSVITTDQLRIVGVNSDVTLANAANDINTLLVTSGNNVSVTDVDAIDVGSTVSNTLNVLAGGDINQNGTTDINGAGASSLNSGGSIAATGTINQNAGTFSFISANNITLNQTHTAAAATTTNMDGGTAVAGTGLTFFDLSVNSGIYQTNGNTTTVNGVAVIASTADLIGIGTIDGDVLVQSGGELAPGNSPGCIATGSLTLAPSSTASFEILGTTPCTQHDQIQVTGTVDVTGATLNLIGGYANAVSDVLVIIQNDGVDPVTGTFAGLAEGAPVSIGAFSGLISYVGGDGNDVILAGDNIPPVVTCPGDITVSNDPGQCDAVVTFTVTATDNLPGVTLVVTPPSGSTFPVGTTLVTATATDAAGNTATCTFNVTVNDTEDPVASCPADITVNNDPGVCGAVVTFTITATDNCPGVTVTSSPLSGTVFPVGTTLVTVTSTDAAGNTDVCTFNVTVNDNEPPVATCPADITVSNDAGQCSAVVNFAGSVTDNCPGATISYSPASGTAFPVGTTLVTATATDAAGNTATCTFNVTVNDTENPTITCPMDITVNNDAGLCSAVITYTAPTGTDNCPGSTTAQTAGLPSGSAFPVGTTTNTFVVTDASGNTATCSFDVTVIDAEDPTITCPADITVGNDPGVCGATVNYVVTGTDNCTTAVSGLPPQTSVFTGNARGYWFTAPFDIVITGFRVPDDASSANQNVQVMRFAAPPANFPGTSNYDALLFYAGSVPGSNFIPANVTISAGDVIGILGTRGTNSTNSYANTGDLVVAGTTIPIARFGTQNDIHVAAAPQGTFWTEPVASNPNRTRVEFEYETPLITQTAGLPSGSVFPVGTTTNTFVSTDGAGNTVSCSFDVTVNDTEDPVITCPADITINNDPGLCSGVVNYTISATDNCGSIATANLSPSKDNSLFAETPGNSNGSGQLMYVGQNGVDESHRGVLAFDVSATIPAGATITGVSLTMTADHPSANNGAQDFNLYRVLEDWGEGASDNGTAPGSGGGGFGVPGIAPDATWDDAMLGTPWAGGPGGTFNPASSANQTVDTNGPYMWSSATLVSDVQDMLDNPGTNFGWIIIGNETTGGGTTKRFGTRESSIPPVLNITYSVDTPLTLVQTAGLPSGSAFPVGTTTNTFVVTDAAGNSDTCSFDVIVIDNEPPVAICQDITVQLDANGMASITAAQIDNGSNDNCGIASLSVSPSTFDCSNVGANTVTLTVTDTSGNSSTCTATVTVEDNVPPVAMCVPDFTLPLDASGNASLTAMDIDNGSTDACGIASLSISPSTFDCSNVGPNTVTLTVTDVNGNVSTCTTVVTVVDVTPPQIVCPPDVNASNDAGICGAIVTFPDAIAIDECGIMSVTQTMGLPSGSVFPVGTTTIEYTATDVNGNTNTCSFDITVTDDEPPVAVCQDITIQLDAMGNATITPAQLDGGSTDNCGIASLSVSQDTFDCSDVGPNNVVLTVTDIYGNSSTCTAVVTVEDVTPPVAVCMDITVQLDVNGMVTVDPALVGGASTDACGIATLELDINMFDCSNVGDNPVVLTVTDVNGNVSTCTAIITVEDNIAPDLVCMDITVELDENGFAEILPEDVIASNTDACGIFTSAVDIFEFDCDDIGAPITVTVFTIDVNGNISSCTAEVTVVDVLAPEVTCPEDQTVDPGAGNLFYEVPDYWASGEATATDNCTDPLTIFSQDPAPGTLLGDGTYTVTLCSTDEYGNEACCTFELTVESILGGADPSNFGTITLYPNPANSEIYLSNPKQMELEQVSIYDMTGRLIKTVNLEGMGAEKAIDISELASATYMFIINNEYGQMTKSIIKE